MNSAERMKLQAETHIVSPSADDWVALGAKITVTGEIWGLKKDGRYFTDNKSVELPSIDLLSYGHTDSHIHSVDGDSDMEETMQRFFEIPNVAEIYLFTENGVKFLWFVLSEDADDIAYQLAVVKCSLSENYRDFNPEIRYTLKSTFDEKRIPPSAIRYNRR